MQACRPFAEGVSSWRGGPFWAEYLYLHKMIADFFCCSQGLALAIYDLWYGFTSRCNGGLSFENFSGLQSGSSHQICSLPGPVQHLPYQVVLHFQHSHYSPVCPGVKLVRHLPDAFCPLQWQLAGQPAGHLVCEYSFSPCIHLYKGTIGMWAGRDVLWILRHTLIGSHAHWNSWINNLFELIGSIWGLLWWI